MILCERAQITTVRIISARGHKTIGSHLKCMFYAATSCMVSQMLSCVHNCDAKYKCRQPLSLTCLL